MSPQPDRTRRRLRIGAAVLGSLLVLVVSGFFGWRLGAEMEDASDQSSSIPESVPVVVFLGDSYASGVGASTIGKRWTTLTSAAMGWSEINAAAPGMGYTTSYQGQPTDYSTRVDVVAAAKPDIVVISGGRNDYVPGAASAVGAAAGALFDKVRAAAPEAEIIVVSPVWDSSTPPDGFPTLVAETMAAAVAAGAEFLEIGEPLSNRPDMIDPDGLHPNDLGHREVARAVVAELQGE